MTRQKITLISYLIVILAIVFYNYRQGSALYYAERAKISSSLEDIAKAMEADAENPEIYKIESQLGLKSADYTKAADSLRRAIKLRENDHMLWLRLGYAYNKLGDYENARAAYETSLRLAPEYAQTNRFMGRLLLKTGEIESAFSYLRKAAEADRELYPEVLHLARKQFPADGAGIERLIAPETTESKQILAAYLIKHSLITAGIKNFMLDANLSDGVKSGFINSLIEKNNYGLAREIWLSQKSHLAFAEEARQKIIIDGDFENTSESDAAGFGWRVVQSAANTSVSIDQTASLSGRYSMRFELEGKTDLNTNLLAQTVLVEPNQEYTLEFDLLSSAITSYGGIYVIVTDNAAQKVLAQSAPFKNTEEKWEHYRVAFRPESGVVSIAVRRTPCAANPCPIFADFRLDNFTLRKK